MQYSVVNYKTIKENSDFRIDAECYLPIHLQIEASLKKIGYKTIANLSKSVINFGAYSLCNYIVFQDSGIPFVVTEDIKNNIIEESNFHYISIDIHKMLFKSHLKRGQILLTMAGAYLGQAAVFNGNYEASSNQAIAKITLKDELIDPYFISTFLNSKIGQSQIERFKTGTGQPNLNLGLIQTIKIPILSNEHQRLIREITLKGINLYQNSKSIYSQAEDLLLKELGLSSFTKVLEDKRDLSWVVNLSEVKAAERMDADYFQPKYNELISKIKKQNAKTLENFARGYSTGYPFKSENYQDKGIPLIRINNIKKGYLDLTDSAYLSEKDYLLSPKDIAKPGDIVLSMSGTIGMTAIIPNDVPKCSINQRILRITPKDVNEDYLVLLLNSLVGLYQLERIGTGGVQTNISYKDIKDILIPVLPKETQQKIADLVRKSHQARKKSKELLEKAKRKVEEMIEKGGE